MTGLTRGVESIGIRALVHDQSQMEVSFDYPVPIFQDEKRSYKIDIYFFVPKVMGISSNSYSRDQFYNDMTNYIRIHTPYEEGSDWITLRKISSFLDQKPMPLDGSEEEELNELILDTKLFGNSLNTRLKKAFQHLRNGVPSTLFEIKEIIQLLQTFRETCISKVLKPSLRVPAELHQTLILVDEYLSNRIESTFAEIHAQSPHLYSISDILELKEITSKILRDEIRYRDKKPFHTSKSTDSEREYFYYRQSALKKFIAQPLFLKLTRQKQERKYRNAVASVGAALAAVWSQFADHSIYKTTKASDFGFQFLAVAMFAVVIYVFKDRIKDMSKEYVNEKLKSRIPDFKGTLDHRQLGEFGATEEYFRFLDEESVPSEIQFLRRLEGRWDVETPVSDSVLHYHRSIYLSSCPQNKLNAAVKAVKDILRFNFSYFLNHLDDPIKKLATYDSEDGHALVHAPKVYHLNFVIQAVSNEKLVEFEKYRLIFNKEGILRLESIPEQGSLFFLEGEV